MNPSPSPPRNSAAIQPSRRLIFAVLAFVQATLIFTIALIMIPLPRIAADFGLDASGLLLLQVAYGLPFSGLLLFGGRLADRFGGRRMLVPGLLLFLAASLAAAAAPDARVLVATRLLQGMGGALTAPAAMAILRKLFPAPADFGRAMATWGGVSVLGAVIGFVASGIFTTWISWRWMFAVPVVVAGAGLATAALLIPPDRDTPSRHSPGLDLPGATLATAGILAVSLGLIASGEHGWSSGLAAGPLAAGIALLVGFLAVEHKSRQPLLPPGFVLDSCRIVGLSGMLLAAAGSALTQFVLPLYLQDVRGWSPLATALSFLPYALGLLLSNPVAAALVGRIGAVRVTILGFAVSASGLAVLALVAPASSYLSVLLPGQLLLAAGLALTFSGSAVLATTNVPAHQAGLAGGVMNTAMELGPTIGLAALMSVAAAQVDTVDGYGLAFGTAAFVYIAAALGSMLLARRGCALPSLPNAA